MKTAPQSTGVLEFARFLAIMLLCVLGFVTGVLLASMQLWDWPTLDIDRENVWLAASAIAITFLLPQAVFITLKQTAIANHDAFRPDQAKKDTLRALHAGTATAIACAVASIVWARGQSVGLNKIVFDIAVSLPALALIAAIFFFETIHARIKGFGDGKDGSKPPLRSASTKKRAGKRKSTGRP